MMTGFGFIEYKDPMDARDVVPGKLTFLSVCIEHTLTIINSLPYVPPRLRSSELQARSQLHPRVTYLPMTVTD